MMDSGHYGGGVPRVAEGVSNKTTPVRAWSGIGKRALITGATSGIGYALAVCFAREGHDLVLVARHHAALRRVADELVTRSSRSSVDVIAKDLSIPSAAAEVVAHLRQRGLSIDVLVNNAGFGVHGPFVSTDWRLEQGMLSLNMVSLTELTKLLLPGMLQRHDGKILNVASTAAFQPGPMMALYYATKAYVLSLSEALSDELRGSGVTVTALCPGPTRSAFQQRAGIEQTRLMHAGLMDADTVARAGFRALMRGQRLVIPGIANRLVATAVRWLPRGVVLRAVRRVNERA